MEHRLLYMCYREGSCCENSRVPTFFQIRREGQCKIIRLTGDVMDPSLASRWSMGV
jgi:hypothetical protein